MKAWWRLFYRRYLHVGRTICWHVRYDDGSMTYGMTYDEATGLKRIYGGEIVWVYPVDHS